MNEKPVIDVVRAVLESMAEESIKEHGPRLIDALLAVSIGHPAVAIIASVAKAVIRAFFHTASSVEKKLDTQLAEPMLTAEKTLSDVLAIAASTDEEKQECQRLLTMAADNLAKAYSYARQNDPSQCKKIRANQALIAALRRGTRPFVRLYSQGLLDEARAFRNESTKARDEAEAIESRDFQTIETLRREWNECRADTTFGGLASVAAFNQMLSQRSSTLSDRANELARSADALESFHAFIQQLASRRDEVLESPKGDSPQLDE